MQELHIENFILELVLIGNLVFYKTRYIENLLIAEDSLVKTL